MAQDADATRKDATMKWIRYTDRHGNHHTIKVRNARIVGGAIFAGLRFVGLYFGPVQVWPDWTAQ